MEERKRYTPQPRDHEQVALPEGLLDNIELLAENVHETWSRKKMDDGWRYGPLADELNKTHPSLVPYEDLPENEKQYDRITAISTLKMVVSLGFSIT